MRLQQGEVDELAQTGRVEDCLVFGPNERLTYGIETHEDDEIALVRSPDDITVLLPGEAVEEWAYSDQTGFEILADNGEEGLTILIEKDFSCLVERSGEDDSDAYRNPASGKQQEVSGDK